MTGNEPYDQDDDGDEVVCEWCGYIDGPNHICPDEDIA